jgi:uncharacterized protein YcfJ
MITKRKALPALALGVLALALNACTTMPTGPSRMALPGSSKNFDEFRADDASCRQYALENTSNTPTQAQEGSGVKSAVVGTAIGAIAGVALGGSARGAAAGAGAGLILGSTSGASAGDQSGSIAQRRYDDSYTQCMYSKGHRVSIAGGLTERPPVQQQPNYAPPPPPPGSAPPPSSVIR